MSHIGKRSAKFALWALTFISAGLYAVSCRAGDLQQPTEIQVGANAPAVNSNPGTSRIFRFAIRNATAEWRPMSGGEKLRYYRSHTYGPKAFIQPMASAARKQAMDSVPQWGQGMEGYGKRFASVYGRSVVKHSIALGFEALWHEDPRYLPSGHSGVWRRGLYATCRAFVSQKDDGGIRLGYSRFIAAFGSSYISRQWHPASYRTPGEYFYSGALSIGFDAAENIFLEFWPDLRKKLRF